MKRFKVVLFVMMMTLAMTSLAMAATTGQSAIYDSIPSPLPPNIVSLGYEATSTDEFGDYVQLVGDDRSVDSVVVTMSNWALRSTEANLPFGDATGYLHPITLNIYEADTSGSEPALGNLIETVTQDFLIPWRPEADPTCSGGTAWRASDGSCYNGFAFNITFNLSGVQLPSEIIFGIAYNTQHYGNTPLDVPGPYNSLNVGLNTAAPSVGIDVEPDAVFWDTSHGPFYADGGAGGVDTFRRDTAWAPHTPTVQFNLTWSVPTNANDCKKGGWQTVKRADGSSFKNQGDCIQYVNTGK